MKRLIMFFAFVLPVSVAGQSVPELYPYGANPLVARERAGQAPRLIWEHAARLDQVKNARVKLSAGETATFALDAQGHLRLQTQNDQPPPLLWLSRDGQLWRQAAWTPSGERDEWLHVQDTPSPLLARLEAETALNGRLFVAALDAADPPRTFHDIAPSSSAASQTLVDDDGQRRTVQRLVPGEVLEWPVEGPAVLAVASRPLQPTDQAQYVLQQYVLEWAVDGAPWQPLRVDRAGVSARYQIADSVRLHGGMDRYYLALSEGAHRLKLKASQPLLVRLEQAAGRYALDANVPGPTAAELARGLVQSPLTAHGEPLAAVDALRRSNHIEGAAGTALGFLQRPRLEQEANAFPGARPEGPGQALSRNIERRQRFFRNLYPDAHAQKASRTMRTAWFATTSPLDIASEARYYLREGVLERLGRGLFTTLDTVPRVYPVPARAGPSRLRLAVARLMPPWMPQTAALWVQFDDEPAQRLSLTAPAWPVARPGPEDAALSQRKGALNMPPTLGGRFTAERTPGHYWPTASVTLPLPARIDKVRVWSDTALPVALQYRAGQPFVVGEHAYRTLVEKRPSRSLVERLHQALLAVPKPDSAPLPFAPTPARALENQWYPMLRYLHAAQAAYLDGARAEALPAAARLDARLSQAQRQAARENWTGVIEALGRAGYGQHPQAYRLSQRALEKLGEHYLAGQQRTATAVFAPSAPAKRQATEDLLAEYAGSQAWARQVALLAARFLREGDSALLAPLGQALHRAGNSLWASQLGVLIAREGKAPAWLPEAAEAAGWIHTADRAERTVSRQALRRGDRAARRGDAAKAMAHWRRAGAAGRKRMARMRKAQAIARALGSAQPTRRLAGVARWLEWSLSAEQSFAWASLNQRLERSQGLSTLFSEVTRKPLALPHASAEAPLELEVVGPTVLRAQLRRVAPKSREAGEIDWLSVELVDAAGKTTARKKPLLAQAKNAYLAPINRNTETAIGEDTLINVPPGLHRVRLRPQAHAYLARLWQWRPTHPWAVLPPVTPLALKHLLRAPAEQARFVAATEPGYFQVQDGEIAPLPIMPPAQRYTRGLADSEAADLKGMLASLVFPDPAKAAGPTRWPPGSYAVPVDEAVTADVPESSAQAYAQAVTWLWRLEHSPDLLDLAIARLAQLAEAHAEVAAIRQLVNRRLQGYRWERMTSSFESAGVRRMPLQAQMYSPFRRVRQALLPGFSPSAMLLSGKDIEGAAFFTPEPTTVEVRLAQRVLPHAATAPAAVLMQLDDRTPRRVRLASGERVQRIHVDAGQHALRLWLDTPRKQQFVTAKLTQGERRAPLLDEQTRRYHIAAPGRPASFYVQGPAWVRVDEWSSHGRATSYRFVAPGWQSLSFRAEKHSDRYYRLSVLRQAPAPGPLEPSVLQARLAAPAKGPAPPPRPAPPVTWQLQDHASPGAGLNSFGGYVSMAERIGTPEGDVTPAQASRAVETGVRYRFRQPERRLFSRSDLLLRRREGGGETLGAKQWVDFYPEDSRWQLGFFGEAYLQPGRNDPGTGDHPWSARLQGSAERLFRLSPTLRHKAGIALHQRWLSLDAVPEDALADIDIDVFSPYKRDHMRRLKLSDRLTWSPREDQRAYLEGTLVSNALLNPFDPDYAEISAGARQLFGGVSGEAGVRWRHYFNDADRDASADRQRLFVGTRLLSFNRGANALTLRAEGVYDVERGAFGFQLGIEFEANEGRLSPARRPDELAFLPLRRALQRERVDVNRLIPQYRSERAPSERAAGTHDAVPAFQKAPKTGAAVQQDEVPPGKM